MHEIVLPKLGMSMEEGTIVAWVAGLGDAVKEGQPLLQVETDKAVFEVVAPADGVLGQIRAGEGQRVPVGSVLGVLT